MSRIPGNPGTVEVLGTVKFPGTEGTPLGTPLGTLEVLRIVKFPGNQGTLEPLKVLGTVKFPGNQGTLELWRYWEL